MSNPVGRPIKYKTPEDMQRDIDLYFETDAYEVVGVENGVELKVFAPTVSGLAFHLGMTTESFRNYENRDEFFATVKAAKQRVEIALEKRLFGQSVTGVIFNLKNNFGWKDKNETDITTNGESINKIERVIIDANTTD